MPCSQYALMESTLIEFGMPILTPLPLLLFASIVRSTFMQHSMSLAEYPGTSVFINTTRLSCCSVGFFSSSLPAMVVGVIIG